MILIYNTAVKECNETDIRLVDKQTSFDGGVEICNSSLWEPVCGDMWDFREAGVVCRQLGFNGSNNMSIIIIIQ